MGNTYAEIGAFIGEMLIVQLVAWLLRKTVADYILPCCLVTVTFAVIFSLKHRLFGPSFTLRRAANRNDLGALQEQAARWMTHHAPSHREPTQKARSPLSPTRASKGRGHWL
jgi:hypothetical protein